MTPGLLAGRPLDLLRLRRADVAALGAVAGVVFFLVWPALVSGEAYFERDVHSVWHGQVEAFVRSVAQGSWPVWDPSVAFGQPLLGNPNSQILYPPNWTSLILAPWTQYTLYSASHLLFAGVGLLLLARRYGCSRSAATVAAMLWVGSGPLLSLLNVWHHFAGAAWLPWVVLGAERALASRSARDALAWGAAVALQLLAGSPDMVVLTGLFVGGVFVCRLDLRRPGRPENRQRLLTALGAAVFAAALSAAQWMPTLSIVLDAQRAAMTPADRAIWAIHPWRIGQLVVPLDFSWIPGVAPELAAPLREIWQTFVRSTYLGAAAVALVAAGAIAGGSRRLRTLLLLATGATLLYVLGKHTPVQAWASELIPPLGMLRYPSKFSVGLAFCWSLLGGLGFDALARGTAPRARHTAGGVALVAALACGLTLALRAAPDGVPGVAAGLAAHSTAALAVAAVLSSGAATLLLAPGTWTPSRGLGLAALAVLDLVSANRGLNPTAGTELFRYRPEILRTIGVDPRTRIYVFDYAAQLPGKATRGMLSIFLQVPGEWPRQLEQAVALQDYLYPPIGGRWALAGSFDRDLLGLYPEPLRSLTEGLRAAEETPAFLRLLRIGAVDFVVALHQKGLEELEPVATIDGLYPRPIRVYRVPGTLPRAYAVTAAIRADGVDALLRMGNGPFDPWSTVALAETETHSVPAHSAGRVEIASLRPDRVELRASLDEPGYVVLLDSYDSGWQVRVDGHPARLLRANLAFRAVAVAEGDHVIEFLYRPASLTAGLLISSVALLGGIPLALREEPEAA